jgi:type II secretory pathway pseudopilin PulG
MNQGRNIATRRSGFTLVELLLAMTFISMLLLTIALTIIQVANIYNRGMLLKELNQVSRTINDEIDATMRSSSTFTGASGTYVKQDWGGRMCMGQYSYIWNYGKDVSRQNISRNQYTGPNTAGNSVFDARTGTTRYEISFVKAPDSGGVYCIPDSNSRYLGINPVGAVELMRTGDHSLAIHALSLVSGAATKDVLSGQQTYKISYTLGTTNVEALNGAQTACLAPGVPNSDFNYCSIQQFTIVTRVVSGVN